LTGRTVLAVERVDAPPGPKTADLERAVGQRIEAVTRRGKFLLLPLRPASEPTSVPAESADAPKSAPAGTGARPLARVRPLTRERPLTRARPLSRAATSWWCTSA
jgi:hypothetical protein